MVFGFDPFRHTESQTPTPSKAQTQTLQLRPGPLDPGSRNPAHIALSNLGKGRQKPKMYSVFRGLGFRVPYCGIAVVAEPASCLHCYAGLVTAMWEAKTTVNLKLKLLLGHQELE